MCLLCDFENRSWALILRLLFFCFISYKKFAIDVWFLLQASCGDLKIPLPFNMEILRWSNETRKVLSSAKVPQTVKFYNIYGTNIETPHTVWYGPLLSILLHSLID